MKSASLEKNTLTRDVPLGSNVVMQGTFLDDGREESRKKGSGEAL
jgi:hypothetical protein